MGGFYIDPVTTAVLPVQTQVKVCNNYIPMWRHKTGRCHY